MSHPRDEAKLDRVRRLMEEQDLDALVVPARSPARCMPSEALVRDRGDASA